MDQLCCAIQIYLLSQAIDINFNQVGFAIEMIIPDVLDNFAGELPNQGMQQEEFKQCELFRGEGNNFFAASGPAAMAIQLQVGHTAGAHSLCEIHGGPALGHAPDNSASTKGFVK